MTNARLVRAALPVLLLTVCAAQTSPAAPPPTPNALPPTEAPGAPQGAVWVTLGADAFSALSANPAVLSAPIPPQAEARRAGVVVTRLDARDLPAVSGLMHDELRRCSGFVVHRSRDEAMATLLRLDAQTLDAQKAATPISALRISQSPAVDRVLPVLEEAQILGTISHLSTAYTNRYYVNTSGADAALWIRDLWQGYAAGRPDISVETVDHGFVQRSVVLTFPGTDPTVGAEEVILGAHLDSINTDLDNTDPATLAPGADDDASGVATLSEVIRALIAVDFQPDRTVRFMAYAAEEVGLVGSGLIADGYVAAGTDVVAVLQLDMTAFNASIPDIALVQDFTDPELTTFLGEILDAHLPELQWTTTQCGYGCSDHASWTNRGFVAAFPFETLFVDYNKAIHGEDDTLATLGNSAAHALKFGRLAAAFTVEVGLLDCAVDADCDDGLYCNGVESCVAESCVSSPSPCGGGACDEAQDVCTSVCGDGTCDAGETCVGCAADCPSYPTAGAACGNGLCEAADGEDCMTCPGDCAGVQSGSPSGRFCCGFGGSGPIGCADPACTSGGFSCTETLVGSGGSTCCGDLLCEEPESGLDCPVDCGAPAGCGDGTCDAGESSCSCAADCGAAPSTEAGSCSDGVDNDCDLAVDCADSDCAGDAACQSVDCATFADKPSCQAEPACRWNNQGKACVDA